MIDNHWSVRAFKFVFGGILLLLLVSKVIDHCLFFTGLVVVLVGAEWWRIRH